jgi:hypothetical protein
MYGTELNIAQLTVILMNSLVIMENVNLKAMSVMGTMTVEIIVMKKDVVSNCDSDEFTCDNGECEPQYYVCDEYDDCGHVGQVKVFSYHMQCTTCSIDL